MPLIVVLVYIQPIFVWGGPLSKNKRLCTGPHTNLSSVGQPD